MLRGPNKFVQSPSDCNEFLLGILNAFLARRDLEASLGLYHQVCELQEEMQQRLSETFK